MAPYAGGPGTQLWLIAGAVAVVALIVVLLMLSCGGSGSTGAAVAATEARRRHFARTQLDEAGRGTGSELALVLLPRRLHGRVRPGEHQRLMPVTMADQVWRGAVGSAHLDYLRQLVGGTHSPAVHMQPVSHLCAHGDSFLGSSQHEPRRPSTEEPSRRDTGEPRAGWLGIPVCMTDVCPI